MTLNGRLIFALLSGIRAFLRAFGYAGSRRIGSAIGDIIWHLVPSRRRLAVRSIASHLGIPEGEARAVAKASFRHTGRSFLEIVLTDRFGLESPSLRFDPPDLLERFRACERPIVAATAHFGAWELLASLLGQVYESPRPRMVVVRKYPNEGVHAFIASCREARGATMVGHRQAVREVIKALHANGIVAFLVDHNTKREEAAFIPFLGETAAVNRGPALLAVRGGAEIWPVVLIREGNDYVFTLGDTLDTAALEGTRDEKIEQAARFYTAEIEKFIRRRPE
ncbi:MAG: lysophospholipid acyltransferase family protein, partial [Mailhella sp.]|nr:lysophospholipid acyltransferase family protein [Mailhella sp.]